MKRRASAALMVFVAAVQAAKETKIYADALPLKEDNAGFGFP